MEGHNWIGNQSPWPGPSDPSHRPDHSVAACFLRLPPFRGRCSSAKLSAGSLFFLSLGAVLSSCRRLLPTSTVRQAPFGVPLFFRYSTFSLSYYFFHLFRFAGMPLPPLIVRIRLEICKGVVFFLCRIPYTVPCCFDLLYALRYKRYANVTHYLGLGLRVFCPVLRVSLPFSRGSVATLFDSTIYFHFNIFKSPTKLQSSRFQRPPFSFGTGIQIHCMYFV